MHILPGFIALALLCARPAYPALDLQIGKLAGEWAGSVTTFPDGCVWEVKAALTKKSGGVGGNFNYSGPCSRGENIGVLNASPSGQGCFSFNAGGAGLPKMRLSACFDLRGDLVFSSMALRGSLKFSEEGRKAGLDVKAPPGGASGTLRKVLKHPAKKEKKNVQPLKVRPLEIYGGGG